MQVAAVALTWRGIVHLGCRGGLRQDEQQRALVKRRGSPEGSARRLPGTAGGCALVPIAVAVARDDEACEVQRGPRVDGED